MKRKANLTTPHKSLLILLMLAALSSCMSDVSYMAFRTINPKGWCQADTLTYSIDSLERSGAYGMYLLLHTEGYSYANIALNIIVTQDSVVLLDTVARYDFSVSSAAHSVARRADYAFPLCDVELCDSSSTVMSISHLMSDDPLKGIREVGIRLEAPIHKPQEIEWRVSW